MFSRIVPAFTPQNIGSLAPLTVISLIYGVAGATMAWTIRRFFWVPHRFRYGILAAGGWANYGDIRMYAQPDLFSDLNEFVHSDGHCDGNYGVCSVQRRRGRKSSYRIHIYVDSCIFGSFFSSKGCSICGADPL